VASTAAITCSTSNLLEIDVSDEDPEYDLPNNYKLELRLNGTVVGRKNFSLYCTLNNTFSKANLTPGIYTYKVTSTCTGRIYEGIIEYEGGYYGTSISISQSYCK
jgi:hypothetical protein